MSMAEELSGSGSGILDMEMKQIHNEVESPRNGKGKEMMTYAETELETAVLYSHNYVGRPAKLKPRRQRQVTMSDEEERSVRVNESCEEGEVQNNPHNHDHHHVEYQMKGGVVDKDPTKLQRILAKRQSARRTRLRKRQYALELEGQLKALEMEMAIVPTRIKYFNRHNASLKMQCSLIEQKISLYTTELDSKKAQYESMMREREVLTQLYMLQRQRRLQQQYSGMGRGAGPLPMNWNQLTAAGAGQLQLGEQGEPDMNKVNQLNDTTFNHAPTLTNTKPCFLKH